MISSFKRGRASQVLAGIVPMSQASWITHCALCWFISLKLKWIVETWEKLQFLRCCRVAIAFVENVSNLAFTLSTSTTSPESVCIQWWSVYTSYPQRHFDSDCYLTENRYLGVNVIMWTHFLRRIPLAVSTCLVTICWNTESSMDSSLLWNSSTSIRRRFLQTGHPGGQSQFRVTFNYAR